jgi:hypothetical protein
MKRASTFLVPDPNAPGLRVCKDTCVDVYDPWRLPPRATEDITVRNIRPEVPLVNPLVYTLTYTPISGTFTPGETLLGTTSLTQSQLVSADGVGTIVYNEVAGLSYTVGEIVIGTLSGATGTANSSYGAQ